MLVEIHQQQAARIERAELLAVALLRGEALLGVVENPFVQVGARHQQSALPRQPDARDGPVVTHVAGCHGVQVAQHRQCLADDRQAVIPGDVRQVGGVRRLPVRSVDPRPRRHRYDS
ncbi:MAG: hypothetical protein V9E93_14820 [Steroidobacteraceae bacterium]